MFGTIMIWDQIEILPFFGNLMIWKVTSADFIFSKTFSPSRNEKNNVWNVCEICWQCQNQTKYRKKWCSSAEKKNFFSYLSNMLKNSLKRKTFFCAHKEYLSSSSLTFFCCCCYFHLLAFRCVFLHNVLKIFTATCTF
jgi:hypothetical protein